jgi:hypothetical protein
VASPLASNVPGLSQLLKYVTLSHSQHCLPPRIMSSQIIAPSCVPKQEPDEESGQDEQPADSPRTVETPEEFKDVPEDHPAREQMEQIISTVSSEMSFAALLADVWLINGSKGPTRGVTGGIVHCLKGIPSCVWVENGSDQDIVVRVSKRKPARVVNRVNFSGGPTGVEIGGEAEVSYHSLAARTHYPLARNMSLIKTSARPLA